MALVFLTFVPLFWSIPISLAAAELNSILPVQGGFYRWSRAAFGDFWGFQCGWWNWTGTFLLEQPLRRAADGLPERIFSVDHR